MSNKTNYSVEQFIDTAPERYASAPAALVGKDDFFNDRVLIRLSSTIHIVKFSEIVRIESDNGYSSIILEEGKRLMISKTLSKIESQLPVTFIRVHQSHIINLRHLKYVDKREGYILTMSDDSKISLSMRKRESFLHQLESFIEF